MVVARCEVFGSGRRVLRRDAPIGHDIGCRRRSRRPVLAVCDVALLHFQSSVPSQHL